MGSRAVRISNLHKKVRFRDLMEMFGHFGKIVGFRACDDAFVVAFESSPERALAMDRFPLAYKRMRVELTEWSGEYDRAGEGRVVVFEDGCFDAGDIRDECSMFGHVLEVVKRGNVVYVVCETEADAERVFGSMYGRFYNRRRMRCRVGTEADILAPEK